jgi:hypothetical protein
MLESTTERGLQTNTYTLRGLITDCQQLVFHSLGTRGMCALSGSRGRSNRSDSMKTSSTINFIALSLLLSGSTLGQGTFLFQNLAGVVVDAPIFDAQGIPLAGPDYLTELYGGPTVDSLAPAIPRTMVPFFTGIGAGYFQAPTAVIIAGVPGGDMA